MEAQRSKSQQPLLAIWLTWLVGPASFGTSFWLCKARPELCNDPPNMLLGLLLMATHLGAGGATLAMLLTGGRYRRVPEFWLLCAYWIPLTGFLLLAFLRGASEDRGKSLDGLMHACMVATVAFVAALPLAAIARRVIALHRSPTPRRNDNA